LSHRAALARETRRKEYAVKVFVGLLIVSSTFLSCLAAAAAETKKEPKEWKVPARDARRENPVAADEKSIAAGKKLYIQECADCHGGSGRGDGAGARDLELDAPMPDLSDPRMWKQTDGSLFFKITRGREPMPGAEELSEQQRWHVVNYVRTLAPKPRDGEDAQAAKGK
jgi:mono/diheme cytochrome c family protein